MYCSYCQNLLADDAAFCSRCGKSVAHPAVQPDVITEVQPMPQYQMQRETIRNSELSLLNNLMQHFSKKQASYDLYDDVCDKVNRYARGCSNALLIWGIIVLSLASIIGLVILGDVLDYGLFDEDVFGGLIVYVMLLLGPGAMMLTGGILKKVHTRRRLNFFVSQHTALSHELHQHYMSYPNCPIGPEFCNPRNIYKLYTMVLSGRTDTLKESLNHLVASSNQRAVSQYLDLTHRNVTNHGGSGVGYILISPRFFR